MYSRPALPGDQIRNDDFANHDVAENVDGSSVQGGQPCQVIKLLVKIAMVVLAMTTLLIVLVTLVNRGSLHDMPVDDVRDDHVDKDESGDDDLDSG